MKKIVLVLIALFLISYTKVEAATYNISASTTSTTVGENVNVTVTVYAGAWNLHISGDLTGDFVGYSEDGNATRSQTFIFNKSTPGTYKVNLTGDITDYDTEERINGISREITITVNPAPVQSSVTTQSSQPVQQAQTTQTSTTKTNQTQTKKLETKNEEGKEDKEDKKEEKKKIKIDEFYVVGYDIKFNSDKLDYVIDVDKSLKAIYVVVSGEDLEVTGDKEVSIVSKNRVVVRVKSGDTVQEYTIKLNRINQEVKKEKKCSHNLILIGTTVLFSLTTIGLGSYMIIKRKKKA